MTRLRAELTVTAAPRRVGRDKQAKWRPRCWSTRAPGPPRRPLMDEVNASRLGTVIARQERR